MSNYGEQRFGKLKFHLRMITLCELFIRKREGSIRWFNLLFFSNYCDLHMETIASSAKYKYVSSGLNTLHCQGPSPPIYF